MKIVHEQKHARAESPKTVLDEGESSGVSAMIDPYWVHFVTKNSGPKRHGVFDTTWKLCSSQPKEA